MPSLFDYLERAFAGPIMMQKDFHMKVLIPNIRKIVKEYEITYDPAAPVPSDDRLADRLFAAAIDFLERTGLYCNSTNRIVPFCKNEILRDLSHYREGGTFGEGRDRATITPRRPGDSNPPWCHIGTGIVTTSEEIALAQVEGYAQVAQANSISIPALETVRGVPIVGGSPLELYGVFSAIATGRKALWRAGRPGLPILNLCSAATTDTGTIAGCYPAVGLRLSDGWLIDFLAEMTIDFNNMNKLAFVNYIGGNVGSTDLAILGGYAGGAPGTALVMTAYHIAGCVFMKGAYHLTGPVDMNLGCSSTRAGLWVHAIVGRATSRNTNYCAIALPYAVGGPCTKTYFYEAAASMLAAVTSGYAGIQMSHPSRAVVNNGVTPTEAQFNADVAHAIAKCGMGADRASELCNHLLEKYEEIIKHPAADIAGKTYPELYDVEKRKRSDAYDQFYKRILDELATMGIPILE
ncbi:MAG: monomethylamine:corrinoid methyltransferase [Pseudomonadota bacterium]